MQKFTQLMHGFRTHSYQPAIKVFEKVFEQSKNQT
jgi:hypothetical protein